MAMQYTHLGQTDLRVSTVAYGTWQFGGDWGSFEAREAEMSAFERVRKVDTLQPPYDLFPRDIERDILPYCHQHGIGVLVYGPMAHGLLAGHYTPSTQFSSDDWRSKNPVFQGEPFARNLAVVERLKEVARQQGITVAQLAVAWVLANLAVDVAIVGARHPQQLDETAKSADVHLTPETMGQIERIMRDAVPMGGPTPETM